MQHGSGDAAGVGACLAAGADTNVPHFSGETRCCPIGAHRVCGGARGFSAGRAGSGPREQVGGHELANDWRRAWMDDPTRRLFTAVFDGDAAGARACLVAGADANGQNCQGWAPMHTAAYYAHKECAAVLVAGGGRAGCVQLLLGAGADPLAATPRQRWTHLHCAALANAGRNEVIRLLLQAGPAAALVRDHDKNTPLTLAIRRGHQLAARCLLELGPLPPAREVLAALADSGARARPLYITLVSRQALPAKEWAKVPTPCFGLGAALPAVLGRSAEEAVRLVRHLPGGDRERLRTAALCLARAQCLFGELPTPIVWRILARSIS